MTSKIFKTNRVFQSASVAICLVGFALANPPCVGQTPERFDHALGLVLKFEGGLVDHPHDPAGRTNFGIPQRRYDEWCKSHPCKHTNVVTITSTEVEAIYREYWTVINGDDLPEPLAIVLFDCAVLHGASQCRLFAQRAALTSCKTLGDARITGDLTSALNSCEPEALALDIQDQRLVFCARLIERNPKLAVFKAGWEKRIRKLKALIVTR